MKAAAVIFLSLGAVSTLLTFGGAGTMVTSTTVSAQRGIYIARDAVFEQLDTSVHEQQTDSVSAHRKLS